MPVTTRANSKKRTVDAAVDATINASTATSPTPHTSLPPSRTSAFSSLSFLTLAKTLECGFGTPEPDDILTDATLRLPNRIRGCDKEIDPTACQQARQLLTHLSTIQHTEWQRSPAIESRATGELQQGGGGHSDGLSGPPLTVRAFESPAGVGCDSDSSVVFVFLHGGVLGSCGHFVVCRGVEYVMLGCRMSHPYIATPRMYWENSDGSGPWVKVKCIQHKRTRREVARKHVHEQEEVGGKEEEVEQMPFNAERPYRQFQVDADDVRVLLDVMRKWFEAFAADKYH